MKNFLKILIIIIITVALVAGGGYYYFNNQKKNWDSLKKDLQDQIEDLNSQINSKVVIYGDSRSDHETHEKIASLIKKEEPYAVFHTGDLVGTSSSASDWQEFSRISSDLRDLSWFYAAFGNHEGGSSLLYENVSMPTTNKWYSLNIGKIHFTVLDSISYLSPGSEQYKWLKSDLENASGKSDYIIAIFHHPLFSTGNHGGNENLRENLVPLFKKYDADIVFNGHDHSYERSYRDGIYYIVTGGGGAPLYDQESSSAFSQKFLSVHHFCTVQVVGDELEIKVYDIESNLIDEIKISK